MSPPSPPLSPTLEMPKAKRSKLSRSNKCKCSESVAAANETIQQLQQECDHFKTLLSDQLSKNVSLKTKILRMAREVEAQAAAQRQPVEQQTPCTIKVEVEVSFGDGTPTKKVVASFDTDGMNKSYVFTVHSSSVTTH